MTTAPYHSPAVAADTFCRERQQGVRLPNFKTQSDATTAISTATHFIGHLYPISSSFLPKDLPCLKNIPRPTIVNQSNYLDMPRQI